MYSSEIETLTQVSHAVDVLPDHSVVKCIFEYTYYTPVTGSLEN